MALRRRQLVHDVHVGDGNLHVAAAIQHGQVGRCGCGFQFLHEAHVDTGLTPVREQHLAVRILAHRRDKPAIDT